MPKGEYHRNGRPVSWFEGLDGRRYKSKGERDIADWLLLNGIPYAYEDPYPVDTRTSEYRGQYRPDFHIRGTDVYVEYYGTDRRGNVPRYYESRHGGTPKEEYRDSILWKRRTHRENGTRLVELYAWQRRDGSLSRRLRRGLARNGVKRAPLSARRRIRRNLRKRRSRPRRFGKHRRLVHLFNSVERRDLYLRRSIPKGIPVSRYLPTSWAPSSYVMAPLVPKRMMADAGLRDFMPVGSTSLDLYVVEVLL